MQRRARPLPFIGRIFARHDQIESIGGIGSGEWGMGNGERGSNFYLPAPNSPLPTPHWNMITPEILEQHNITPEEYERIRQLMGREPNLTELGIFSVMWSEHCSYKSSKVHLRRLPTEGECLVQGPGENAGIVDIGDGWCAEIGRAHV